MTGWWAPLLLESMLSSTIITNNCCCCYTTTLLHNQFECAIEMGAALLWWHPMCSGLISVSLCSHWAHPEIEKALARGLKLPTPSGFTTCQRITKKKICQRWVREREREPGMTYSKNTTPNFIIPKLQVPRFQISRSWSAASLNSNKATISNTNELSYPQLCRSANARVTGSDSNQICQICDLLKVPKSSYLITQNYQ